MSIGNGAGTVLPEAVPIALPQLTKNNRPLPPTPDHGRYRCRNPLGPRDRGNSQGRDRLPDVNPPTRSRKRSPCYPVRQQAWGSTRQSAPRTATPPHNSRSPKSSQRSATAARELIKVGKSAWRGNANTPPTISPQLTGTVVRTGPIPPKMVSEKDYRIASFCEIRTNVGVEFVAKTPTK